jgi:multidrug efflux system membrane fusion protein
LEVLDNQIDQMTGTVRLKAVFPNKDLKLWPGGFVNVRLLVETLKQAVVVPVASLQRGPKGPFVYVLNGDKVAVRSVTPAQQDEQQAVISAGLKADELVVTTGFAKLTDGARVSAAKDESAAPAGAANELHQGTGVAPPNDRGTRDPQRARERQRRDGAAAQATPPPGPIR